MIGGQTRGMVHTVTLDHSLTCLSLPLLQQTLRDISQHELLDLTTPRQRHLITAVLAKPEDMYRRLVPAQYFPHPTSYFIEARLVGAFLTEQESRRNLNIASM